MLGAIKNCNNNKNYTTWNCQKPWCICFLVIAFLRSNDGSEASAMIFYRQSNKYMDLCPLKTRLRSSAVLLLDNVSWRCHTTYWLFNCHSNRRIMISRWKLFKYFTIWGNSLSLLPYNKNKTPEIPRLFDHQKRLILLSMRLIIHRFKNRGSKYK